MRNPLEVPTIEDMSLRDCFALSVANGASQRRARPRDVAEYAYQVADAMLEQRLVMPVAAQERLKEGAK